MPEQTRAAIDWALTQTDEMGNAITKDTPHVLVDKVREYFNTNNITYSTFSFSDLDPFLS